VLTVGEPLKVDETYHTLITKKATPFYPPRYEPWKMRSALIVDNKGNLIKRDSDSW